MFSDLLWDRLHKISILSVLSFNYSLSRTVSGTLSSRTFSNGPDSGVRTDYRHGALLRTQWLAPAPAPKLKMISSLETEGKILKKFWSKARPTFHIYRPPTE
jgi:hypothetical protein